jgi:hypothetical protein
MIDPALGDGKQDATEAIKTELDRMSAARPGSRTWREGGVLQLHSGIYRITDTIVIPRGTGFRIQGVSPSVRYPTKGILPEGGPWYDPQTVVNSTALMWDGDPGKPMIVCSSSGSTIDGIAFWGKKNAQAPRAAVGIQFRHKGGIATGHTLLGHVGFSGCETAIRCGEHISDGNCGDITYTHVEFFDCGSCVRAENHMSLNHTGLFVQASGCDRIYDFEAGGKVSIQNTTAEDIHTVLRARWTGSGNEAFYFGSIHLDASQPHMPVIVKQIPMDAGYDDRYLSVLISQLHASPGLRRLPRPSPVFDLQPRGRVRVLMAQWLNMSDYETVAGLTMEHVKS